LRLVLQKSAQGSSEHALKAPDSPFAGVPGWQARENATDREGTPAGRAKVSATFALSPAAFHLELQSTEASFDI
jgi:hypothetical protein